MRKSNDVVLIGHNFNSILGLARALGEEGYNIGALRTGSFGGKNFLKSAGCKPESKCKYITKYLTEKSSDSERLVSIVIENFSSKEQKPVLIPVDDNCAEIIDSHLELLSHSFYVPNIHHEQGEVVRLMDKYYQKQLARAVGLPVPEGWSVIIKQREYTIPEDIRYPCFAKAEMPMKARKKYMGKCNNKEELRQLLDKAAAYQDCSMIIEEFVDIEKEYGCVGICNGERVCIPCVTEKTTLGHGSQAGVTACGKIHKPQKYKKTVEKLKNMMASIGFQGMFDIDLYESNGVIYFNELNVRMGAEGVGTLIAGVNLAKMFVLAITGEDDAVDYSAIAREITFASERPLISDYVEGYISWKKYRELIKGADARCIYSTTDKKPYYDFVLFVALRLVFKIKNRLKKNAIIGHTRIRLVKK